MRARGPARSAKPKWSDAAIVADIIAQLEKGGPLNDPRARPEDRLAPLAELHIQDKRYFDALYAEAAARESKREYVRREVQRSLNGVRLQLDPWPQGRPADAPPARTLADYRKAAKALREVAFTEEQREAIRQLEAVEQEPPERGNALKHYCAAEAYFIMEMFSAKAPTGYKAGTFRTIAVLIYEAVSGEAQANLERACETVLHSRRRFQHRFKPA
jgi:hypothetical protein